MEFRTAEKNFRLIHPLLQIATSGNDDFQSARTGQALQFSISLLELYRNFDDWPHSKVVSTTDERYQVVVPVDSVVLAGDTIAKTTGGSDRYIEKEVAIPVETARRLSCSCKIVTTVTKGSEPLSIGRSSRAIPTGIRRALAIRDGMCFSWL